jgi:hypothetical protein
MKDLPAFPLGRVGCFVGIVNALLAVGLTFASAGYIQPKDCNRLCGAPEGTPCPSGACRFGEQRAGWPLPIFVDTPGGGSPTNGWGILGPEDPLLLGSFVSDVLIYSLLLWLTFYIIRRVRGQVMPLRLLAITMPLTGLLAAFLWFIYLLFGPFGNILKIAY